MSCRTVHRGNPGEGLSGLRLKPLSKGMNGTFDGFVIVAPCDLPWNFRDYPVLNSAAPPILTAFLRLLHQFPVHVVNKHLMRPLTIVEPARGGKVLGMPCPLGWWHALQIW